MTRLNFNIVFTIEGPHQQQQQNHCLRTDNSLSHLVVGVNVFYWRKIFSLDYIVVKTHNLSSSHRGFLINYKLKQVLPLPPRDVCRSFMFLFCLVFAMFCARLFICALWSPAGKGLTSWLSFVVSSVSLSLSHWYPGSGVVLDCIDS